MKSASKKGGTEPYAQAARRIRADVLHMTHKANASHVGTCLSMADILAVLYGGILNYNPKKPEDPKRDRLILSKGHGAAAAYAALAQAGFFPRKHLDLYCADGSPYAGHVTSGVPGVEVSTGSLGHGLPIACGMALAGKRGGKGYRVFAILSDGECDEGSTWEAALFAGHHRLDNIVAIIDYNKIQSFGHVKDVLDLEPFADKWRSFRWSVAEVDGHDFGELHAALSDVPREREKPTCIIAHTVKGKGVSFMEGELAWHYRSPDREHLKAALKELEEKG